MASSTVVGGMLLLVVVSGLVASTSAEKKQYDACYESRFTVAWLCQDVGTDGADPVSSCCEGLLEMKRNASACFCNYLLDCTNTSSVWGSEATKKMMQVPDFCGIPLGASDCPDVLGLSPDSSVAAVFKKTAAASTSDDEPSFSSYRLSPPSGTATSTNEGVVMRIFSLGTVASSAAVAAWILA